MSLPKTKLAVVLLALIVPIVALAFPLVHLSHKPDDDVASLRTAMADRLALIPDVARHKWNTGTAIADPAREQVLIEAAVVKGRQFGIPDKVTRAALEAQIIASKQMQQELIDAWQAAGEGTFASVPDFLGETRPKIEEATNRLIREFGAAQHMLDTCAAATALRQPPSSRLTSAEVWATAAEGMIQSVGGPTRDSCLRD